MFWSLVLSLSLFKIIAKIFFPTGFINTFISALDSINKAVYFIVSFVCVRKHYTTSRFNNATNKYINNIAYYPNEKKVKTLLDAYLPN